MRSTIAILGTAAVIALLALMAAGLGRPIYLGLAAIVAAAAVAATIATGVRRSPTHRP